MPRRSILFLDKQLADLNKLAEKSDRSVNWHVRKAVDEYLARGTKQRKGKKL
jgi:predicted transcriptional regulator